MRIQEIVTTIVLTLALIITSTTTAAAISCDCGDICVNQSGWWRDNGALNASTTPIQAAVDNATAGETICVKAGSYTEKVNIAKPHLTLRGEGAGVVTVNVTSISDHAFEVTANYVNISGFNATGATDFPHAGIYLGGVDYCNISENTVSNNYRGIDLGDSSNYNTLRNNTASNNSAGIYLSSSSNNILTSNTASNNSYGVYLHSSSNNTLTNNNASLNDYDGIYLYSSSNYNTLTYNNCSNNNDGIVLSHLSNYNTLTSNNAILNDYNGIQLYSSSNNTLTCNNCSNNSVGICLGDSSNNTLVNNTASNNSYGIDLSSSNNNTLVSNNASLNDYHGIYLRHSSNYNTLTNNTASNNSRGIELYSSSNNTLVSNNASLNDYDGIYLWHSSNYNTLASNTANSNNYDGIYLYSSSNNTLTNNNASSNNNRGIYLSSSSDNLIYNNYFNNTNNAYDDTGSNIWNATKTNGTNIIGGRFLGGNYWSDYVGIDNDSDGLGDTLTPYNSSDDIEYGGDYHPLVMVDNTPSPGITYLQNITHAQTYINWTWTDPVDSDFLKVIVYLDGVFQENVTIGVQCYNATSLTPGTAYEIGTLTVDTTGNINQTWVNHTATTASTLDNTAPMINSVTLAPTDPNIGDNITVTVNATDNVGVTAVTADGVSLSNADGDDIWEGTITAIEGTHTVNISASDAAANTVYDETANYTATPPADTTDPVINSVILDPTDPNTGDNITVTVNVTDNVEVTAVTADGVSLSKADGNDTWKGTITAIEGTHTVNISASDAAGNTAYETANYTATPVTTLPVVLVEDVTAVPNGYAFTSITVNNVTGLGSGDIIVTYNSSVVHAINVTSGDGNALTVQNWNVDNIAGLVQITAWDVDESHNGDVVFAYVNFHAVGEYPDSTPLAISSSELFDYTSYVIIGHNVSNGTFSIISNEPPVITDAIATPDVILNDNGRPRTPGTNVTVLNATVLDNESGVVNVTIDLSPIGGSDDQVMDRIAGTDVWTVATTATDGINLTHELVVTATDGADNTNTSVIGLTVLLRGDVVRDGDLNSADSLYIAKYLVGKESMPSLLVSDMSPAEGDGKITSADALYLAKYLVGNEAAP